jgi:hypothetical protein
VRERENEGGEGGRREGGERETWRREPGSERASSRRRREGGGGRKGGRVVASGAGRGGCSYSCSNGEGEWDSNGEGCSCGRVVARSGGGGGGCCCERLKGALKKLNSV